MRLLHSPPTPRKAGTPGTLGTSQQIQALAGRAILGRFRADKRLILLICSACSGVKAGKRAPDICAPQARDYEGPYNRPVDVPQLPTLEQLRELPQDTRVALVGQLAGLLWQLLMLGMVGGPQLPAPVQLEPMLTTAQAAELAGWKPRQLLAKTTGQRFRHGTRRDTRFEPVPFRRWLERRP